MKIRALRYLDVKFGNRWSDEVEDRFDYDQFKADAALRKGWISMDCSLYNPEDDRIYLGITSFDSEIFRAYDRKSGDFFDLGYSKIADPFDAKFHRSLVKYEADGCLYGAIALLHCSDKYLQAPGGAIIKYDPKNGHLERLNPPVPHVYIQSTALDQTRGLLYCQCFPPEYLITYNLMTGAIKNLGLVGSGIAGMAQGENIALDDDGNLWGAWAMTRAWQYNPGNDYHRLYRVPAGGVRIEYLKTGLPRRDGSAGFEKLEALFNLGDGYMYASAGNGSLYRIDRRTGQVKYLFTPINDRSSRLASLTVAPDGCAYGVTGRDGRCELLRFDFRNSRYELMGEVKDQDEVCWQVHHICMAKDGTLYACENDNPYRSSFLWEICL